MQHALADVLHPSLQAVVALEEVAQGLGVDVAHQLIEHDVCFLLVFDQRVLLAVGT